MPCSTPPTAATPTVASQGRAPVVNGAFLYQLQAALARPQHAACTEHELPGHSARCHAGSPTTQEARLVPASTYWAAVQLQLKLQLLSCESAARGTVLQAWALTQCRLGDGAVPPSSASQLVKQWAAAGPTMRWWGLCGVRSVVADFPGVPRLAPDASQYLTLQPEYWTWPIGRSVLLDQTTANPRPLPEGPGATMDKVRPPSECI